jgi:formate hydrogenlyase subunit 6/NADH:ubiquinone oxidoreductase subunit I
MPFVKTEVNIRTDYSVETVDPEWLKQGVKSPKHLMLDPEPCILCRACEDVCPWNCIYMLDPGIVQTSEDPSVGAEVENSFAIFVVDDNACTRCSVCVERCPSDCLYYARLPEEEAAGRRTMAAVPTSQRADEDGE